MIDAEHIAELQIVLDAADPPSEFGLLQIFPVIDRVAPELTVLRERVGRASGDLSRDIFLIKEEHLRVCPCVSAVECCVEGDVAYDLDPVFIGIRAKFFPLLVELILLE